MRESVTWAREHLEEGWSQEAVLEALLDAGYDPDTAEHVVGRAAAGMEVERGGRRWLVPAALVILLVAAGGAVALNPGVAAGVLDALPLPGGGPASFADLARTDATYQVEYAIQEGNSTSDFNLTVSSTPGWTKKTLVQETTLRTTEVSAHTYRDTRTTVFCGDTLQSLISGTGGCTQASLYALIFPLLLTSAHPFADDLDAVNVTDQGADAVNGMDCRRYRVDFDVRHLYDEVTSREREAEADALNVTTPGQAELCLDTSHGYAVEATFIGREPVDGGSVLTSQNMTITAQAVTEDGEVDAEPPVDAVLSATCPDEDTGEDGNVTMLTLADSVTTGTLSVNGANRSVSLTPYENTRLSLATDDVAEGENEFVLYAGDTATDTCNYGSVLGGNFSLS